ncbi:MAG: carbohydrate ABC transporter permease [Firmicutes bacterium]|nr:carbohydrate ABC transporter permease [Bacillota bacterium]
MTKHNPYTKFKTRNTISQILIWTFLIIALFIFSVPFLIMIASSFEEFSYVLPYPPKIFPTSLNFSAYIYVLEQHNFLLALKNSVINTSITVVIAVFISSLSAYGFSRIEFPGREVLFGIYLFTLMMPSFLNIIPQFIVLRNITFIPGLSRGLIGSRLGLILVYVATSVCGHTFFLRNFFKKVPTALSESVVVDGGGHFSIFFRIILPLSTPAIGTMSIFALQGFWEEYFTAKILVGANETMITLPLLLQRLNGEHATRWEWVFAASLLALIPIIILFIVFQRKLVIGGLTQGAVKE